MTATGIGALYVGDDAAEYMDNLPPGEPVVLMTPAGVVGVVVQSPAAAGPDFALAAVAGMLKAARAAVANAELTHDA